jgi:hypothetical protein
MYVVLAAMLMMNVNLEVEDGMTFQVPGKFY